MRYDFTIMDNRINRAAHGIDLFAAQALWQDPDLLEIPAQTEPWPRSVVIGRIAGEYWSAVIARQDETNRIVLARRSTEEEASWYELSGIRSQIRGS